MTVMCGSPGRRAHERARGPSKTLTILLALLAGVFAVSVNGAPLEQAKRIHDRLAGVPPTDTVLNQMVDDINGAGSDLNGDGSVNDIDAAFRAMENRFFYDVTLKNFAAPWTNRDQSVFVPFNDYVATVIGMVRDDVDFSTLLSADLTYVGQGGVVASGPSAQNNDHYAQLEANNVDLSNPAMFNAAPQSSVMGIPANATAGVMTSRAAS